MSDRLQEINDRMSFGFYLLDGKEPRKVTMEEWSGCDRSDSSRVDYTETENGNVSTVFLGCGFTHGDGPPLLFETMVLGGTMDGRQDRYPTWEEAEKGHAEFVERINNG